MEEALADMFYFDFYAKIQKVGDLSGYLQEQPATDRDFPVSTVLNSPLKIL